MAEQASTYDGFISYSHAADDLLAPRLQWALQRFAKPWWKRRAVRIFRDESSLSANPHLWSSITEALDTSGWFVLLLSPDAARSEWVNQEIAYWVEHRDPKRILPVVTDGAFGWADGDVAGDAVPDVLRGVFSEEPRWVDVRWAKGEDQLDLQDPRFADAVADIASTIRGIPKDDLASEEVRQHRRTVRTAWAAGIALLALSVVAIGASIQSARNADEAERQAEIAAEQAGIAEASAQEADRQAEIAKARELAASGVNVLDEDPELALLLTLRAIDLAPFESAPPIEVLDSLWQAASANRLIEVYDLGTGPFANFALSPDGARMGLITAAGPLALIDIESGSHLWTYSEETVDTWMEVQYSPDGSMVALSIVDSDGPTSLREVQEADSEPNRIHVFDSESGEALFTARYPDCGPAEAMAFSPDSRYLALSSGAAPGEELCRRPESPLGVWVEVFDTASWESKAVLDVELANPFDVVTPAFDLSGTLYVLGIVSPPVAYSADTFDFVKQVEGAVGARAVSPDGSVFVGYDYIGERGPTLWSADTGEVVDRLTGAESIPQLPRGLSFAETGEFVFAVTGGAFSYVWEAASGDLIHAFRGGDGDRAAFDESRRILYTNHGDGAVRAWNMGPPGFSQSDVGDLGGDAVVGVNSFAIGERYGLAEITGLADLDQAVVVFDLRTGALVGEPIPGARPQHLADDTFAVAKADGPPVRFDAATRLESPLLECIGAGSCDEVALALSEGLFRASVGGDAIATRIEDVPGVSVIDLQSGTRSALPGTDGPNSGFLGFGATWVALRNGGSYVIADQSSGEEFFASESTIVREYEFSSTAVAVVELNSVRVFDTATWTDQLLPIEFGEVGALAFGPADAAIAIGDEDRLRIFDLKASELAWSLPIPNVSDVHWLDQETLLIGTGDGLWTTVRLEVQSIVGAARSVVRRGFTSQECSTYRIDPCPSLEDMKGR